MAQWLRLRSPNTGGSGLIPGGNHMPQPITCRNEDPVQSNKVIN